MASKDVDLNQYLQEKTGSSSSGGDDVDLEKYLDAKGVTAPASEEPGLLGSALHAVSEAGKKISSYTSAPARAAIAAAQDGKNPLTAFGGQFGEDPDKAPTGKDIVVKAGVSDDPMFHTSIKEMAKTPSSSTLVNLARMASNLLPDSVQKADIHPSPADVAGTGIDIAADPLNAIPLVGEAKPLLRAIAPAAEAAEGASKAGMFNGLAEKLKAFAESSAVNATGATAKQASTFSDNAGRELLDRGIVKFGDSQSKIASRASQALDEAHGQIDAALKKLSSQGVTVDANKIYEAVHSKINALKQDPSQSDIAKILDGELGNLLSATDARGSPLIPIDQAELIKRGYGRKAGNWADPEKGMAGKEMYQTTRGAVEDAATAADPEAAKLFEEGKKTHGLLSPIQEAAERRALTNSQSQHGGLMDVASTIAGEAAAGPAGAIAIPVARKIIAPRIASSLAVTADSAANALRKIPAFADMELKNPTLFSNVIAHVASSGGDAISKADDQPAPAAKKGPDKWANDGFDNLINHAGSTDKGPLKDSREKLMSSAAGKKLLISASDLKPGSKAMSDVLTKVKAKLGEAK
jgi:hypothetical protein